MALINDDGFYKDYEYSIYYNGDICENGDYFHCLVDAYVDDSDDGAH